MIPDRGCRYPASPAVIYHEFQMRRGFSIFLILLFWLGPLAALLPAGDDDSRLPICCRRHGAHHCAMSTRMAALMSQAASGGKPVFTAPPTCPFFPGYLAGPTLTIVALTTAPICLPAQLARPLRRAARRANARISQIRTRAGRGPPASNLA
jgi:hypothetical protein